MSEQPPKKQLSASDKHLLRLVKLGRKPDGWTSVSRTVWPLMAELALKVPELVSLVEVGEGGIAKLTTEGETVVAWV